MLRTYSQGREIFQGYELQGFWADEEPPEEVYGEAIVRTMTTNGIAYTTFTPLKGMTKVALSFMPKDVVPDHVREEIESEGVEEDEEW